MLPSDLTLSVLRFILSAKSRQSCLQDCETVDFCNSLNYHTLCKRLYPQLSANTPWHSSFLGMKLQFLRYETLVP